MPIHVPEPFAFNALKHHLNAAKAYCLEMAEDKESNEEAFFKPLKAMSSNLVDIYTGNISVFEIITELKSHLIKKSIFEKENFFKHMEETEYLMFQISDESNWIIGIGNDFDKYIHIHPARSGQHLKRTHVNAWKTVLGILYFEKRNQKLYNTLEAVNYIRSHFLKLSPVKKLMANSRIMIMYHLVSA